jgi:hypothetical protein
VSAGTYTLRCGCVALIELERVVTLCPAHWKQYNELHERAAREHRAISPQEADAAAVQS